MADIVGFCFMFIILLAPLLMLSVAHDAQKVLDKEITFRIAVGIFFRYVFFGLITFFLLGMSVAVFSGIKAPTFFGTLYGLGLYASAIGTPVLGALLLFWHLVQKNQFSYYFTLLRRLPLLGAILYGLILLDIVLMLVWSLIF